MNISHSVFVNNHANKHGGAVSVGENILEIYIFACTFSGNTATKTGGAIHNVISLLIISQTLFENNSALTTGGGAIYVATAFLNMTNSVCSDNQALQITSKGGAIRGHAKATIFLQNVIFQNNIAEQSGGALAAGYQIRIMIRNCSFTRNEVDVYNGGAIFIELDSMIIIHDSAFYNNQVQQLGCIFVSESLAYLTNSIFINNIVKGPDGSSSGGGIFVHMSPVRISRCTFIDNIAKRGLHLYTDKSPIFTYEVTFQTSNNTLKSTDKDFQERAQKKNIIYIQYESAVLQETPYASSKCVSIDFQNGNINIRG